MSSKGNNKILVARLVVRDGGDNDGLVLGFLMRGGENVLRRGMVYDVLAWSPTMRAIMGEEVTVVEAGPSCIPRTLNDREADQTSAVCWGNDIGLIVEDFSGVCLTREEYADLLKREGSDG